MTGVTQPPVPQRIGDADRDRAAERLREALAEGRLDTPEFEERLERALSAKTQADLEPLFIDLPALVEPSANFQAPPWQRAGSTEAGSEVAARPAAAVPAPNGTGKALTVAAAVAWPLTIMLCFAISWQYWWLIFIPITISSLAGNQHHKGHRGS